MRSVVLCSLLVAMAGGAAEPAWPVLPVVVTGYVEQAFMANLALQREQRDFDSARARLAAARGALQPRLDLAARYTVARGGRAIDFPIGDLLNPVYGSLNVLTGDRRFPSVENQAIAFLRPEEQETKLRLLQPLYRPEILRGTEAARAQVAGTEATLAAFRRELRLEVQRGYFHWQQSLAAIEIYASAAELNAEAVRVNRALVANDAATEDAVLRVESDALLVRQQQLAAGAQVSLVLARFNLLLNRPEDTPLEAAPGAELEQLERSLSAISPVGFVTAGEREELIALDQAVQAADASSRAAHAARRPAVSLAVESGVQGTSYRSGQGAGFTQASVVAEWNLFDGNRASSRVRAAGNDRAKAEARRTEVRRQLALQANDARRRFVVAVASLAAAGGRRAAAERVFLLVARRDREGLVNQLGFLDARHELTAARLSHATARCQLFIAYAELDRELALTPLP